MTTATGLDLEALKNRAVAADRALRADPDVAIGILPLSRLLAELLGGLEAYVQQQVDEALSGRLENSPHLYADGSS